MNIEPEILQTGHLTGARRVNGDGKKAGRLLQKITKVTKGKRSKRRGEGRFYRRKWFQAGGRILERGGEIFTGANRDNGEGKSGETFTEGNQGNEGETVGDCGR